MIEKVIAKNQIELSAILLEYKNKNFTSAEIDKQLEKELFEEKEMTFNELKTLWNIKSVEKGKCEIFGYKGIGSEITVPNKIG